MIYAPVLITTVSRYQHFKNCLESLSNCTWADKTEVFVAVDYPGRNKDWDGYKQIKDYLSSCGNMGFKSLNVIYRETNYFFSSKGNLQVMIDDVYKLYDRCIVTEDDNVFSPNFLMFIDKGLEKFRNDEKVLAINGYCYTYPFKFGKNNYFRQKVDFSGWGYGMLRDRYEKYIKKIEPEYFAGKLCWGMFWKVKHCGNHRLLRLLEYSTSDKMVCDDNGISCLMNVEDLDVIMPSVSLVRNMGWDYSGIHCALKDLKLSQSFTEQPISTDKEFEFVGTGKENYTENNNIVAKHSIANFSDLKFLYHFIRWCFSRLKK